MVACFHVEENISRPVNSDKLLIVVDEDGVSHSQGDKVPKSVLQHSTWIVHIEKLSRDLHSE